MNARQMAQQIRHKLQQAQWSGGSANAVFGAGSGRVVIVAGAPTEDQIPQGFPWAMISIGTGEPDPDDPGLILQQFTVTVAAEVAGDPMGESAIVGGPITDLGKSGGRGVGDLAERARAAVQSLTGADGARIQLSATSTGAVANLGSIRHIALEDVILTGVCTSAAHYASPQRLRHESSKWVWEGSHCEARFDFLQYRLVRKVGSNPSLTPSDGSVVYTGTAAEYEGLQYDGSTYTIFADYSPRGWTTAEASSGPEVGAYRVVG